MKVKDLMRTRRLVSVRADDRLDLAAELLVWAAVRHLPVLDAGGRVVGVLTERDLLRSQAERPRGGARATVADFMTHPPEVIGPDEDAAAACALMVARKIGSLPVVDEGRLVGILTRTDFLSRQIAADMAAARTGGTPRVEVAMRRDAPTVAPGSPLLEAVARMVDRGARHVVVIDGDRRVVGILSDRDVRTAIGDPMEALGQELTEVEELRVAGVMTTPVSTVREDAPLAEVARRLVDRRVGALPVVDAEDRLVGIVSYVDVIRALLELDAAA